MFRFVIMSHDKIITDGHDPASIVTVILSWLLNLVRTEGVASRFSFEDKFAKFGLQ